MKRDLLRIGWLGVQGWRWPITMVEFTSEPTIAFVARVPTEWSRPALCGPVIVYDHRGNPVMQSSARAGELQIRPRLWDTVRYVVHMRNEDDPTRGPWPALRLDQKERP